MSMTERQTHIATIELTEAAPAEVPVGTTFVVKLAVACTEGCDLHASALAVDAPADAAATWQAPSVDAVSELTHEVALQAAPQTGEQVWRIALPQAPAAGVCHDAKPLAITVSVKPQSTSLAVWDIPSPVVMGQVFEIKAGAKSAGDFKLAGPRDRSLRRGRHGAGTRLPWRCAVAGHQRALLDRASLAGA
jgi:hypothetical protein